MTSKNTEPPVFVVVLEFNTAFHPANKISRASMGRTTVRFLVSALTVLMLLHSGELLAQGVCPVSTTISPRSASNTLNVPEYQSYRHLVGGDYVVIQYNAKDNKTSWTDYNRFFDYRRLNNTAHPIDWNSSFLPVIYTKEKIAVRVCGLHFTDVLTVTTAPNGVPESGADIRGASPVTPVASLSSTLDTLQSGEPTGGTTTLPGLGLNAPAQLPSLAVSGITPGSLGAEDQTPGKYPSYTPATVTASGRQVAQLLYSVDKNAAELTRLIDRTLGRPYNSDPGTPFTSLSDTVDKSKSAPGSVNGVAYILGIILGQVISDSGDLANSAAFDKHLTDIQNLNAQISTLSSALSSQAFASNAIAL